GETSPYAARTAFGLDPIYVAIDEVEDLDEPEIERTLGDSGRRELERVRWSKTVEYDAVRALKSKVLGRAAAIFREREIARGTERAKKFETWCSGSASWEDDLATYVSLRKKNDTKGWRDWPEKERNRDTSTLEHQMRSDADTIFAHRYAQWNAELQWDNARKRIRDIGVELMGDLPFVVGTESADVWQRPNEFEVDASLGAPPDAFTPVGQDWGLPPYRWSEIEKNDFAWLRARVRRAATLYDRFRLDHLIGVFRMYVVHGGDAQKGKFEPEMEPEQIARGKRVLGVMVEEARKSGIELIAEDLGVVPDFARAVMRDLDVPGYRVIPWERDFVNHRYREPREFAEASVASWSTHDTAPIGAMWKSLEQWERDGLADLCKVSRTANEDDLWRAQMHLLVCARSSLALVLGQEIIGDDARINTPGTVGPQNWTYRFEKTFEEMDRDPRIAHRMTTLRKLAEESGR
ncbi:MAG: 4-alpha-glucanotransferase, partial [Polyangiaceae bacterium]